MRPPALFLGPIVVACGIATVAVACGSVRQPGSATVGSLRLSYPAGFDRRYFATCSYEITGVRGGCMRGVVVASFRLPPDPEVPGAVFPSDGVALELYRAPRQQQSQSRVRRPTVRFPISLADFQDNNRGG